MSDFYKPHRNPDWNYGGSRFRLSRSKLDLFMECPRCFYVDNRLGVARPRGFPFNLNNAVDALLKKEFDAHRVAKTAHPLMQQYGIDAVPFKHKNMGTWREVFEGVECKHAATGFTVSGAVDDIWVNPQDELIVVDYKATSKDEKIEALDQEWHRGYKRQMEVYQWLLRQNGFQVSDWGYFVYANAGTDKKAFDGVLEFEVTLVPYMGKADWIDGALVRAKECLESEDIPKPGKECDYCKYREAAGKVLLTQHAKVAKPKARGETPPPKKAKSSSDADTLFT